MRSTSRCTFAFVAASLIATACSHNLQSGESLAPISREAAPRYLVTSTEIQATGLPTAFDALRRLRPELLSRRADISVLDPYDGLPVLYVDRVLQGKLDLLSTLPAGVVVEIRYYSAVAAKHEIGVSHPGGVIAVTTRK